MIIINLLTWRHAWKGTQSSKWSY